MANDDHRSQSIVVDNVGGCISKSIVAGKVYRDDWLHNIFVGGNGYRWSPFTIYCGGQCLSMDTITDLFLLFFMHFL